MKRSFSIFCLALVFTSCNPLGKESSASPSYTPGLQDSTSVATWTVTPSAGAHTTVNPSANQSVNAGSTISFTVTAASSYSVSTTVSGTCPVGTWSGGTYTTGVITANCSVSFSSSPAGGLGSGWTPNWASLLAYWSLEETSYGTVNSGAADFADGGPVGTNYGTHSGAITTGTTGKTGNAVSFANSGCITLPANASFNTTVLTAMAWIKTTSSSIGNILSFYNSANSFQGWALLLNNSAGHATFWGGTTTGFKDTVASNLNNGSWHHFAAVANNTSLKLYVDGALDSTFAISAIPSYSGPGAIGADGDCLQKFTGAIDEMAVWGSALTTSDVSTIYNYQLSH